MKVEENLSGASHDKNKEPADFLQLSQIRGPYLQMSCRAGILSFDRSPRKRRKNSQIL